MAPSTQLNMGDTFADDMVAVDFGAMVAAAGELRTTADKLAANQTALEDSLAHTDAMTGPAAAALNGSKGMLFAAIFSTMMTLRKWATIVEEGGALQKRQEATREAALTVQNSPTTMMA